MVQSRLLQDLAPPPFSLSDEPIFLQTSGKEVVVGVLIVYFAVDGVINAFTNQSCTTICQTTATAAGVAWGAVGVLFIFNDGQQEP